MKFFLALFVMTLSLPAMTMVFKCTDVDDGDQFVVETYDFKEARVRFVFCKEGPCTNSSSTSWLEVHGNAQAFYLDVPKFPDVSSDPEYPAYPKGKIVITIGGGTEWQGKFDDDNFDASISNAHCGFPTPLGFGW